MARLQDWLDEALVDPDVLTADGFDNACLGLSCGFGPQRAPDAKSVDIDAMGK